MIFLGLFTLKGNIHLFIIQKFQNILDRMFFFFLFYFGFIYHEGYIYIFKKKNNNIFNCYSKYFIKNN